MIPLPPRPSSPNYLPNYQSSLGRGIFEGTQFRISLFPISVLNKLKSKVKDEGFDSTWITLGAQIGGHGVRSVNKVGILIKNPRVGQPTAAALGGTKSCLVAEGEPVISYSQRDRVGKRQWEASCSLHSNPIPLTLFSNIVWPELLVLYQILWYSNQPLKFLCKVKYWL